MIKELMLLAIKKGASDIHLSVGIPPVFRINGVLEREETFDVFNNLTMLEMLNPLMDDKKKEKLNEYGEIDFSYSLKEISHFRVNIYKESGKLAAVLRLIPTEIPTFEQLHLPKVFNDFVMLPRGLVLVTGPTGSGKSTTLAAMINYLNLNKNLHIITLEDPIEYRYKHIKSVINQREVNTDTISFASGLRAALREDPDVILVGEMRDMETIATAITAAETGHLVFATLHTSDAASTVNRIIDVFPEHQQMQIRIQLAGNMQGIVAQQLLPTIDGKSRRGAFEVLVATPALRNLIREGKTHQIPSYIQTGSRYGMKTLDEALAELVKKNEVSKDVARQRASDPANFDRICKGTL